MRLYFGLIFWGFFQLSHSLCQAQRPEFKLLTPGGKAFPPGATANLVVELSNPDSKPLEVSLKIQLPAGWAQLVEYTSVKLESTSRQLKILPIHINDLALTGMYKITIEAFYRSDGTSIDKKIVEVGVKPRYDLEISSLSHPGALLAGDSLTANFLIHNTSNTAAKIEYSFVDGKTVASRFLELGPDSSKLIAIQSVIGTSYEKYTRQNVNLTASIVGIDSTKTSAACFFDVIPNKKIIFDPYNRIPVRASGLMISDFRSGKPIYSALFDIQGSGALSTKKNRFIEFQLRGPRNKGNPLMGLNDKYYIKFTSPKIQLTVGDNNYRLSDLTESSRNGFGMGFEYKGLGLRTGGFVNYPRFYPKIKRVSAVYVMLHPASKNTLSFGLLNKLNIDQSQSNLAMLSGKSKPFNWLNLEGEIAAGLQNGKFSMAYKSLLSTRFKNSRAHLTYTQAGIDFPGYLNNTRIFSGGLSTRVSDHTNVNVLYDFNRSNMVLDTLFVNAPFSQNVYVSSDFRLGTRQRITLSLSMRNREDRSSPQLFNYTEYSGRINTQKQFGKMGLNAYFEMGKVQNFLPLREGELTNSLQSNLSLTYRFNSSFLLDGFLNYQRGEKYQIDNFNRLYYGASLVASVKTKLKLLLAYQNNYQVEEYYRDRSLLRMSGMLAVLKNQEIGFSLNYNLVKNSLNRKEFTAFLSYTYSFRLKTSKKSEGGSLKGQILNHGVQSTEGMIINAGGNFAITDKNGQFEFPYLPAGEYYLMINTSMAGLNSIVEEKGPHRVQINTGSISQIKLSMTQKASLDGVFRIEIDSTGLGKNFIERREALPPLFLEMTKEDEKILIESEANGTFRFPYLRPGNWTLKIHSNRLTSGYSLKGEEFQIELAPGEEAKIEIPVLKQKVQIKFQKNAFQ